MSSDRYAAEQHRNHDDGSRIDFVAAQRLISNIARTTSGLDIPLTTGDQTPSHHQAPTGVIRVSTEARTTSNIRERASKELPAASQAYELYNPPHQHPASCILLEPVEGLELWVWTGSWPMLAAASANKVFRLISQPRSRIATSGLLQMALPFNIQGKLCCDPFFLCGLPPGSPRRHLSHAGCRRIGTSVLLCWSPLWNGRGSHYGYFVRPIRT